MVWDVLQDYAENTQETMLNEAYARMVKHGYNMTPFQTFSNAKAQHQVEELVEMIKWTLGSPNLESGRKSYASGKITDAALPGRAAWARPAGLAPPQNTCHSSS